MTDHTKLIEALRQLHSVFGSNVSGDAADAIEALQRKVAELEAQLQGADRWRESAEKIITEHAALLRECEPYLKEDETPAQRIKRERKDNTALIRLLAKEKAKVEELEAAQRVPSGWQIVPIEPTEEMEIGSHCKRPENRA